MIHSIASRKITAFLFVMAWLAFVGQGTSYGQQPTAEGKIYWTDPTRGIQRANLDGTNVEQIVESDVRYPADIALDLLRGKIYWTDGRDIYYSDLDGSNLKPFIDVPVDEFGWPDDNTWVVGVTNIALDVDGGKIYWTSVDVDYDVVHSWMARANLDGSNSEILFDGEFLGDIVLDSVRGKVYWTDRRYEGILRADLNGQNVEYGFIRPDSGFTQGIALDVDRGKIYWTEAGTIQWADLNGQNIEEVLTVSDGFPEEIALDTDQGKIYWTNPGTQTIHRADLDGQHIEILFNLEGDVLYTDWSGSRIGIDLDVEGRKIYWTNSGPGTIQCADLDGQNREVLFDPMSREPHGIALDTDKMYWTDEVKGSIQRADLNGENTEVLITGLNHPKDIALLEEDKIYWVDDGKIQAADLDGSNVKEILTGLSYLGDIALDVVRDKIYWRESFLGELWENTIQQADLDGQNVEPIVSQSTDSYSTGKMALDVLAGKVYWISEFNGVFNSAIQRANLDGSNVEAIVSIPPEREHWDHYEAFALDPIGNKIYGAIQTSTFSSFEGAYRTGTEFSRSNLDGSNIEEMWRPSFDWWEEVPSATTDIALDISHPTSISTPVTTPAIPATSGLFPNFPNPFNASTQIAYDIATSGPVRLTIYNTLGQPMHTLVNQFQPAGFYQVRWGARDQRGTALAAGVYLMRLHYPGGEQTRRLLLLK